MYNFGFCKTYKILPIIAIIVDLKSTQESAFFRLFFVNNIFKYYASVDGFKTLII